MRKLPLPCFLLLVSLLAAGQSIEQGLDNKRLDQLRAEELLASLLIEVEDLKLEQARRDLKASGLPVGKQIEHAAMILSYAEAYE